MLKLKLISKLQYAIFQEDNFYFVYFGEWRWGQCKRENRSEQRSGKYLKKEGLKIKQSEE